MFKSALRVLFLLIILTILLVGIDLPENYPLNINLFGKKIETVLNPISLNVDLPGVRLQKTFKTQLGLDMAGGSHLGLEADMSKVAPADKLNALESAREIIERRVNFFGVSEPVVQSAHSRDTYRIIVELPGVTDVDAAVQTIGQTARMEFREFLDEAAATQAAQYPLMETTKSVGITGTDLRKAQLSYSQQNGEPVVEIEFTPDGGKKFADVTGRLVGKHLAIFLDDFPLTWPTVNQAITDGRAIISGGFTREGARSLSLQLNAGALPVPVKVVEKRVVGAALGQESIGASVRAGAIGLLIVAAFMIAKYGLLGLLADIALIMYGLLSYAIFRTVPITLTLPGVAGFILSIGMAVDSNILIFERFREELRRGKPAKIAMELGFGKAWDSIRDANLTTIITALILYNPGNWPIFPSSGVVRGFAATLLIGVLVSLFTGIVVTRTLVRVFYHLKEKRS